AADGAAPLPLAICASSLFESAHDPQTQTHIAQLRTILLAHPAPTAGCHPAPSQRVPACLGAKLYTHVVNEINIAAQADRFGTEHHQRRVKTFAPISRNRSPPHRLRSGSLSGQTSATVRGGRVQAVAR